MLTLAWVEQAMGQGGRMPPAGF